MASTTMADVKNKLLGPTTKLTKKAKATRKPAVKKAAKKAPARKAAKKK